MDADLTTGHARARWAIRTLYISVACAGLSLLSGVAQWHLLRRVQAGFPITDAAAAANDTRHLFLARLQLVMLVIGAIIFLRWLHRAYANLVAAKGQKTDMTPGWAVGYWFIPFINLVRPYQIMKELWLKSTASTTARVAPASLGLWWASYLVAGGAARASGTLGRTAQTIPQLLTVTFLDGGSELLTVIAGVLLIGLVRDIDTAQQALPATPAAAA